MFVVSTCLKEAFLVTEIKKMSLCAYGSMTSSVCRLYVPTPLAVGVLVNLD